MGITRSGLHKKRPTGGKRHIHRKKRKFELGRPPASTKLIPGERRVRQVRTRGGNSKWRALRLDAGNFSWGSEATSRKVRILDVVYNATNNELVRTKTLVKGAIVTIDGTPFRNWYYKYYGVSLGPRVILKKSKKGKAVSAVAAKKSSGKKGSTTKKKSSTHKKKVEKKVIPKTRLRKWVSRAKGRTLDAAIKAQFESGTGKILAKISSRPGQVGRADGYILEGAELAFYQKRMEKKKAKKR